MQSSFLISWRNLTRYKKRFLFTLSALIIGIIVMTGMLIAKQTMSKTLDDYERLYAGSADYWIQGNAYGFQESELHWLLEDTAFEKGNASLLKQGFVELDGVGLAQSSVRLSGVSSFDDGLFELPEKEGDVTKEGLIITENAAQLWNKGIGDTVVFKDMGSLEITAIVYEGAMLRSPENMKDAKSQHARVMVPLEVLQEWTGLQNVITDYRFKVKEDLKNEELLADYQFKLASSNVFVQPVVIDGRQSNDFGGLFWTFDIIALLTIFISGLIAFNMIYASMIERRKEFAVMKSLGYTNGKIYRLVLQEITLLSVIGTLIGLPLGIWFGSFFQEMLMSAIATQNITYELELGMPLLLSATVGIFFPFLAAAFPVYHAGKTPVLEAMNDQLGQQTSKKGNRLRILSGCLFTGIGLINFDLNLFFLLVGLVLLYPYFLQGIQWLIKPLISSIFRFPGKQALHASQQFKNRIANTSAMLAIGVCLTLFMSAALESIPETAASEIRSQYGGDMHVVKETPWQDEEMILIHKIEEVKDVHSFADIPNITWATQQGEPREFSIMSFANAPEDTALFRLTDKMDNTKDLPTIYLGERAFSEWGGEIGEILTVNSSSGKNDFYVGARVQTSHYNGYVAFVAEQELEATLKWPNKFHVAISIQDEASISLVQDQLWEAFGNQISKVSTTTQVIDQTNQAFNGLTGLMQGLLLLVIGLSSIGISNTLFMNTLERTKEIGTMRAVGFTKQQVKLMIVAEGMIVGITGVTVGTVYGIVSIYLNSRADQAQAILTFSVPWFSLLLAMTGGILFSLLAAWLPSITASRVPVKEAISYE